MPSRFPALVLLLMSAGRIATPAAASDCEGLQAGDTVFAACPGVPFQTDTDESWPLGEGAVIRVSAVAGARIRGEAEIDGSPRVGWIEATRVHRPDDPGALAELRRAEGVELHPNRHGSIARVTARDARFGAEAMAALHGLHDLEGLDLSGARFTNDDLDALRGLSTLRWLSLDRTSVNDEGLHALRHLPALEVLALARTAVRGPGLGHLRSLAHLRVLNLSGCALDDDGLRHLAALPQVQTLALQDLPVRGPGLAHLEALTSLNVLNLSGCDLRPGAVLHLRALPLLRILRLHESPVPASDEAALRAANPHLAVFR
jgi:hypothetical protein